MGTDRTSGPGKLEAGKLGTIHQNTGTAVALLFWRAFFPPKELFCCLFVVEVVSSYAQPLWPTPLLFSRPLCLLRVRHARTRILEGLTAVTIYIYIERFERRAVRARRSDDDQQDVRATSATRGSGNAMDRP